MYGALTACVAGMYVLVVGYLGTLFRTNANLLISLIATGVVAALFQPLRERLQRAVNRLIYGERDQPYAVLAWMRRCCCRCCFRPSRSGSCCWRRAPGEQLGPADRRLLDDLASQAGVALHAVELTAALRRSRQRLVTTREEERLRMRRDLHDGLGPTLAALPLRIDTARTLMRHTIRRPPTRRWSS